MGADVAEGSWLDLADAITLLRDQIAQAQARIADPAGPGDQGVRFSLGEITVELGLELARTGSAEGGLRFAVLGVGLSGGDKREKTDTGTHKMTIQLTPQRSDHTPIEVRDRY